MNSESEVTLSTLLQRSLQASQQVFDQGSSSSSSSSSSEALETTLGNLRLCARLIDHLSLLSSNETLEDLSAATLRCLLVPFWQGILTGLLHCPGTKTRQANLAEAKGHLETFQRTVDQYSIFDGVLPHTRGAAQDPGAQRMAKIAAYKLEKELESKIKVLQERRGQVTVNSTSEAEADEHLRPLMLAQIQQCYLKSISELSSIATESQLLAHAIPTTEIPSEADMYTPRTSAADDTWRLDGSTSKQARKQSWFDSSAGPVLNNEGRVLRPFTITGSSSNTSPESALSTRLALQDTVFGPGYRLPTMSVDEFLDIEYARGNVLQGGEADAQRQEIESARRKQMVEMDNRQGYEEGERRLEEERRGDEFRDTHRRGDGNRIGRG